MKIAKMKIALGLVTGCLMVSATYASPVTLNSAQMDSVAAGGEDTVSGFVCTVNVHYDGLENAAGVTNNEQVAFNEVNGTDANGNEVTYYTVAPQGAGDLMVPAQATNTGTPGTGFSIPGDTSYSPIWNRSNF